MIYLILINISKELQKKFGILKLEIEEIKLKFNGDFKERKDIYEGLFDEENTNKLEDKFDYINSNINNIKLKSINNINYNNEYDIKDNNDISSNDYGGTYLLNHRNKFSKEEIDKKHYQIIKKFKLYEKLLLIVLIQKKENEEDDILILLIIENEKKNDKDKIKYIEGTNYKNISDFIETMKLNDIIINNTQYYSFNSTGNYTLEIIFKKPLLTTEEMFKYCHELTDINLTQFHTGEVENMTDMFNGCDNLKNVNMKNIYAPKLKNIGGMFSKCYSLTSIDLSSFKANYLEDISKLFG